MEDFLLSNLDGIHLPLIQYFKENQKHLENYTSWGEDGYDLFQEAFESPMYQTGSKRFIQFHALNDFSTKHWSLGAIDKN